MFLKLLSTFSLANVAVYAATLPEPAEVTSIVTREVPPDPISKYTTEWFVQNTCNPPETAADCLFYTKGLSEDAKRFANNPDSFLKTIWEMWPKYLYNPNVKDMNNPLRDIMDDEQLRNTYFSNMSRAMAYMCDYMASVMDNNFPDVRLDGIWGQVEFEELKAGNGEKRVDFITVINTDGTQERDLWVRPKESKRSTKTSSINKPRQVADCGTTDDVAAAFDEGGDHPINW